MAVYLSFRFVTYLRAVQDSQSSGEGRVAVVCRELAADDRTAAVALLAKGFAAWRDAAFWERAFDRMDARVVPAGAPRFGYALLAAGVVVGVLLVLASEVDGALRCNVSSWYVEPRFRVYGAMLVKRAFRQAGATFLNVTPAPDTWALLRAQGYLPFVTGRSFGLPALSWRGGGGRAALAPDPAPGPDLPEAGLLRQHAAWDNLCAVCTSDRGRVPFVFGVRRRRGVGYAYLIYCRDLASLERHARPLGWLLARHGIAFLVADADERLGGMPGLFQAGHPKFFRGQRPPRPGDLAFTERAVFGV